MAWRYRKSVKLFPGVRINISNRGISTTVGVKGLSVNYSKRGTYLNTGIPGTGMYQRTRIDNKSTQTPNALPTVDDPAGLPQPAIPEQADPNEIKSADTEAITSPGLQHLKDALNEAFEEQKEISLLITKNQKELKVIGKKLKGLRGLFAKLFQKEKVVQWKLDQSAKEEEIQELKEQLELCKVPLDIEMDDDRIASQKLLIDKFTDMSRSEKIWDITSSMRNTEAKSSAGSIVERRVVRFETAAIPIILCKHIPIKLQNANGSDIYIYPGFVVVTNNVSFGFLSILEVNIDFHVSRFQESERVPKDSKQIDTTWRYINKNGLPDKRYSNNPTIPVIGYGGLKLTSGTGLNEAFMLSNCEATSEFVVAYKVSQEIFKQ